MKAYNWEFQFKDAFYLNDYGNKYALRMTYLNIMEERKEIYLLSTFIEMICSVFQICTIPRYNKCNYRQTHLIIIK